MKRILSVGTILAALYAAPVAAQQPAVADQIKKEADNFVAALGSHDIDRFVALFAPEPDFIYVDAGRIYPDRAALRAAGANFVGSIRTFQGTWDPTKILVYGNDGAIFTGQLHVQGQDTTGRVIWPYGKIWTLAYKRIGGKWQIVQAHEANVPAPRK